MLRPFPVDGHLYINIPSRVAELSRLSPASPSSYLSADSVSSHGVSNEHCLAGSRTPLSCGPSMFVQTWGIAGGFFAPVGSGPLQPQRTVTGCA